MLKHMELLLSVQNINKDLDAYRRKFQQITLKIKSADGLVKRERELQEVHAHQLECKVALARAQKEIEELKQERADLRNRIYGGAISNVRELTAVENEHNHVRQRLRTLENSLGDFKERLEEATKNYDELNATYTVKKDEWEESKQGLIGERNQIGRDYKTIKTRHDERISAIPAPLLKVYNALLKSTNGTPIARVVEGVCQGCFIKLPLSDFEKAKNSSKMHNCNTCNRILFFD